MKNIYIIREYAKGSYVSVHCDVVTWGEAEYLCVSAFMRTCFCVCVLLPVS